MYTNIIGLSCRGRPTEPRESESCIYQQVGSVGKEESQPALNVLLPGMKCVEVFELNLERFGEWVILIEAHFKSPGSGEMLSKRHECCVYLMDLVIIDRVGQRQRFIKEIGPRFTHCSFSIALVLYRMACCRWKGGANRRMEP
jgi:hypothetical protein